MAAEDAISAVVGPGLVELARQLRELGVKRFRTADGADVEFSDAAVMLALNPPAPPPEEAGTIEKLRQKREETERLRALEADLASVA